MKLANAPTIIHTRKANTQRVAMTPTECFENDIARAKASIAYVHTLVSMSDAQKALHLRQAIVSLQYALGYLDQTA